MKYQPKVVFNPKKEEVEFMCGGQIYIFEPGEKRPMDGFVAYHALNEVNTGLVEYDGQDSNPTSLPLAEMPWRNLVSLGAKLGVFNPGMSKGDLIKAIKDAEERSLSICEFCS